MGIVHLLVDAPECGGPLNDGDLLLAALREAASVVGATEYGRARVLYVPHGVTAIVFLAESHMLISTWPEHGLALVDILLCNESMDPEKAWESLSQTLKPGGKVKKNIINRDVSGCPCPSSLSTPP
jgi:S-adenosylmethionine decarboxylase